MRNSIATYKESISRIASDVQEDADELQMLVTGDGNDGLFSDRRISNRFAQSTSPGGSPLTNGVNPEIELHKAEIHRLKASETEIKTLAMNYAAMLKEKEEELTMLHEENGSLKKNLESKAVTAEVSQPEYLEGYDDQLTNRQNKYTSSVSPSAENNGHRVQFGQKKEPVYPINGSGRATPPSQTKYATEIRELRLQLENEQENSATLTLKLQEHEKKNASLRKELSDLKIESEKTSLEMKRMQKDMNTKLSEIKSSELLERLRQENENLKMEKFDIEEKLRRLTEKTELDNSLKPPSYSNDADEAEKGMQKKIQQLESTLTTTCKERDKATKELSRLKQHLLEKELEESNKMDEDSRVIEELRSHVASQQAYMQKLESALKQETMKIEEAKKMKSEEIRLANESINNLKQKIINYANILESRNLELQNLQTALGQYYAETEAKERLERDLVAARSQSARLSENLKEANEKLVKSREEIEGVFMKLSQAEKISAEGKLAVQRLQEDNMRLRRTLEQSMTRINRMSLDSDYSVDRRIVIKLLLTYFERNHGKEVLDLMVRMLGFSEEEKRRIVVAQQAAGKGVVRGVLGLPGRLVGGIVGGSRESPTSLSSENQSFADMWVDFLLKETEQREKRELAESTGAATVPANPNEVPTITRQIAFSSDAEFATVPLTSDNSHPISAPSLRY